MLCLQKMVPEVLDGFQAPEVYRRALYGLRGPGTGNISSFIASYACRQLGNCGHLSIFISFKFSVDYSEV